MTDTSAKVASALGRLGRPMTLTRQTGTGASITTIAPLSFNGLLREFTADDRRAGLQQGEAVVTMSNSEIAAAAWPGPPKVADKVVADGRTWIVRGCETKYVGTLAVAHMLTVKGG